MVLGEFITAQLAHHAKALELYTLAYRHVQSICEDETVEVSHLLRLDGRQDLMSMPLKRSSTAQSYHKQLFEAL